MKNKIILTLLLSFGLLNILTSCSSMPEKAQPVSQFDVNRYLGTWYEIARFDYRFEKDLDNAIAQYSLNADGNVNVVNSGYNVKKNKWVSANGTAKFRGEKNVAALKVSFFGPFYAGYNVVALEEYKYALIAGKNLDYLWILSREKNIPENIKQKFISKAQEIGYDTSKLIWVKQDKKILSTNKISILNSKPMLKIQAQSKIPTDYGLFNVYACSENEEDWSPNLVLVAENTDFDKAVNVRFHSECITGEVFHSKKCECGQQLDAAMKYMSENGGVIIYLRQEGRNIGIINKLKAYALQEQGLDTVEANLKLGLPADARNFDVAVEMLNLLGIRKINLLTNNPDKIKSVENSEMILNSRIPLEIDPNEVNESYLVKKKDYFGHLLEKI